MNNRQKSYGKRYQNVEFVIKLNKKRLLFSLCVIGFIGIIAGVICGLNLK